MKKIKKEEVIRRANEVHDGRYDYSLVEYKNYDTKIKIICPIHGIFEQLPSSHFSGSGCPKCGNERISKDKKRKKDIHGKIELSNTEEFVKKAKEMHGDIYDYSLVDYTNAKTKIRIICPIHGVFEQTPNNHLKGQGCPSCGKIKKTNNQKPTIEELIKRAKEMHGDIYDYSLTKYTNAKTKIKIICPIHGVFEQTPDSHIRGRGCQKCGIDKFKNSRRSNTDNFIKKAKEIHGDIYDYSLVDYTNNTSKIIIICAEHGKFLLSPKSHLTKKSGCPFCTSSIGERDIYKYLTKKEIPFEFQKTFKDCKYKHVLHFDFYLPKENICIEYDGIQHFKSVKYFGGEKAFRSRNKRDKIKNAFIEKNNMKLIRISYDKNIEEILNESL